MKKTRVKPLHIAMADDSRAVRILSDLCGVLRREKDIYEFGFVYCPEPLYNKSPIVVLDGNLGIETWSIKPLYFYAYSQLFDRQQRQHDLKRIGDCSMAVVLLNPECLSAWNLRKQLVLDRFLKAEEELNFARLVLTKHPKSPETFSQRRWLLQRLFPYSSPRENNLHQNTRQDGCQGAEHDLNSAKRSQEGRGHGHNDENDERRQPAEDEALMTLVRSEMDVCTLTASRYPSNYNAWSHRIWVVKHLAGNPSQFLQSELTATKSWVSVHVSDHSGFHYRQFLLSTLTGLPNLHSGSTPRSPLGPDIGFCGGLVLEELQLILDLVTSYPGHEAIWYHRRFVVHLWKTLLCNGFVTQLDQNTGTEEAARSTSPFHAPFPIPNLPPENQSNGNQSTENQPSEQCPSEHQPIENQLLRKCPSENQPFEYQTVENQPIENGHSGDVEHTASNEVSQTPQSKEDKNRDSPFSAMQLPSRCSHDASLLHLSDQHISPGSSPPQKSVRPKTAFQTSRRGVPYRTDTAFSTSEILRLIQHEKRFVDIAVDGTCAAEKAAQRRCADNYCHWLEKLYVSSS